ncbi:hypothetical protein NN561_011728 [Cricetulus griseus]
MNTFYRFVRSGAPTPTLTTGAVGGTHPQEGHRGHRAPLHPRGSRNTVRALRSTHSHPDDTRGRGVLTPRRATAGTVHRCTLAGRAACGARSRKLLEALTAQSVTPDRPGKSGKRGSRLRQKTDLLPQAGDQSQPCHYPHNQWGYVVVGQWERGHCSRHCNKLPEVARESGRSELTFSPHLGGKCQFSLPSAGAMPPLTFS